MKIDNMDTTCESNRLTYIQKLAYGAGDTACNITCGALYSLLFLFYTDYIGVNPVIIGSVVAISRMFDGVSDFIMGMITEKTNSKYGKARPWLLWMSIPFAVCTVLVYAIPQGQTDLVQGIYMFVTYNLVTTVCYTAINLPYGTLSTLMTRDQKERESLSVWRMAMAPIGRMISVSFTLPLVKVFGNDQKAWVIVMTMWSTISVALLIFNFMKCEETVKVNITNKEKVGIGKSIVCLFKNKYWIISTILWAMTAVHMAITGTLLMYYSKYVLLDDTLYSTLYTTEVVILILGAILCPLLLKKINKRDLSLYGAILAVIAQIGAMIGPQTFEWQLLTIIVRSIGATPLITLVFAMLADSVEYGHWKTNVRQEAMIFSASGMGFKFGAGMSNVVIGAILSAAGYISTVSGQEVVQPQTAIDAILTYYHMGVIAVWLVVVIALLFYKLDKIYDSIMEDLSKREMNTI